MASTASATPPKINGSFEEPSFFFLRLPRVGLSGLIVLVGAAVGEGTPPPTVTVSFSLMVRVEGLVGGLVGGAVGAGATSTAGRTGGVEPWTLVRRNSARATAN